MIWVGLFSVLGLMLVSMMCIFLLLIGICMVRYVMLVVLVMFGNMVSV